MNPFPPFTPSSFSHPTSTSQPPDPRLQQPLTDSVVARWLLPTLDYIDGSATEGSGGRGSSLLSRRKKRREEETRRETETERATVATFEERWSRGGASEQEGQGVGEEGPPTYDAIFSSPSSSSSVPRSTTFYRPPPLRALTAPDLHSPPPPYASTPPEHHLLSLSRFSRDSGYESLCPRGPTAEEVEAADEGEAEGIGEEGEGETIGGAAAGEGAAKTAGRKGWKRWSLKGKHKAASTRNLSSSSSSSNGRFWSLPPVPTHLEPPSSDMYFVRRRRGEWGLGMGEGRRRACRVQSS